MFFYQENSNVTYPVTKSFDSEFNLKRPFKTPFLSAKESERRQDVVQQLVDSRPVDTAPAESHDIAEVMEETMEQELDTTRVVSGHARTRTPSLYR